MEGPRRHIFTAVQIVSFMILLWVLATWPTPWDLWRYVGTVLCLIGATGIAIARFQLGRSFSIRPQAKQLVTHGLYARIRNPIYVFGGVLVVGFALVLRKPVLWVLFAMIVVGQTIRARREARVLEAAFGDQYREYRCKTWF